LGEKEALKLSSKEMNNIEGGMAIASFHCLQNVVLITGVFETSSLEAIPMEFFYNLWKPRPIRVDTVFEEKSGHTRY